MTLGFAAWGQSRKNMVPGRSNGQRLIKIHSGPLPHKPPKVGETRARRASTRGFARAQPTSSNNDRPLQGGRHG
ncbi:hypothetical protein C4J94_1293 [Pseudomonas sp. R5-89-07]|nr:hypothetical protein C4J94_1293 [Pseudomonas sp. R5-89-07]